MYEVNEGTLAIVPKNKDGSVIYEDNVEYKINSTPYEVMEHSCKYFGSTYEGRKEGTRSMLGIEYKVPIIVENSSNLILFPTSSPNVEDCCWVSLKRIKRTEAFDNNYTKIVFDNDTSIVVPMSRRSIENQISRASRLDFILRNRQKNKS